MPIDTSDDVFDACMPLMLIQECPYPNDWSNPKNFSNDPHDPGGATMCGIIQSEYNKFRKDKGLPTQSVEKIGEDEGYEIYYDDYWLPHCPVIPTGLNLTFFDTKVNTGPTRSIKLLQQTLKIGVDGIWGPQTMAAVEALDSPDKVKAAISAYADRRLAFYQGLSTFRYFGKGWTNRTNTIEQDSIKMVDSPPATSMPVA